MLTARTSAQRDFIVAAIVAVIAAITFYLSTRPLHKHFDYTFRVAGALLAGRAGLNAQPPSWLNEFVPRDGSWYSVFPLGAVLASVPAALLQKVGLIREWPAGLTAALIAGGCVFFFYRLTAIRAEVTQTRRIVLALAPVFATWTWCNLGLAGAWQTSLGFALLGQTAALSYTLVGRKPLLAGFWFAVALGNRSELLLALPLLLWLWMPRPFVRVRAEWREHLPNVAMLLGPTLVLLLCTAFYNWTRFGSPSDFGYARIPGLLNEPWYRQGLFSFAAVRWNMYEMLFRGMIDLPRFPYLRPHAFGCSIFLASPLLFLIFREGAKHAALCWIAIGLLTGVLWTHGNAGGWQFSYRYAMILLPWMFLLITENGPTRLSVTEASLFVLALVLNALATYEFQWTTMIIP